MEDRFRAILMISQLTLAECLLLTRHHTDPFTDDGAFIITQ